MSDVIVSIGKRKKAIARAFIKKGSGRLRINSKSLEILKPRYNNLRIKEVLQLAGELANKVDIDVIVRGGGVWGQTDAIRTAIANALIKWNDDSKLRDLYLDYDRSILISDSRRTEPHKPSRSSAGPRRTKQQSKR